MELFSKIILFILLIFLTFFSVVILMITSDVKQTNNVDNNNEEDDTEEEDTEDEYEEDVPDSDDGHDPEPDDGHEPEPDVETDTKYKNLHYLSVDSPCPAGCVKPDGIYGNCHSEFYDDSDENCYTKCPYKCSNYETTNDYSICHTDMDCSNCANHPYSLFKIDCTDDVNGYTG
jgi:hypothetical protein